MRLTLKNLPHFLLEKGILDFRSVVDGDLMFTQSQNRNAIFRLHRQKAKSLFVKQLVNFDSTNYYMLQKDATCLWMIKNDPVFAQLAGYVPEYFGYDPENQVLITEFVEGSRNLQEYQQEKGTLSTEMIQELAEIFASFHFPLQTEHMSSRSLQFLPRQYPWALTLTQAGGPQFANQFSQTQTPNPVFQVVLTNPEFMQRLEPLKQQYEVKSLIHGDIKWLNILTYPEKGRDRIKLIDWEIADMGDPMWDIAGVFQAFCTDLVLPLVGQVPPTASPPVQVPSLDAVWPKIKTFWAAYCQACNIPGSEREALLEKAILFTGARLVQTAIEFNMPHAQLQPISTALLQISYFLLSQPEQAQAQLLEQTLVS